MSFRTSLIFCRPGRPPIVHGLQLAEFIRRFNELGVSKYSAVDFCNVKWGEAIDQDGLGFLIEEGEAPAITVRDIEWDVRWGSSGSGHWGRCHASLVGSSRPIYRASVVLGPSTDTISDRFSRDPCPENDHLMCLWDWGFGLGPETVAALDGDTPFQVGWMGLSLSGQGYPHPWSIKDVTDRTAGTPQLRNVEALCREFWPAEKGPPTPKAIEHRRSMGDLWPHPVDSEVDWCWVVSQSG